MTDLPLVCVIDANVAVKLFIDQPDSGVAYRLFQKLENDPFAGFHVPDFFYAECANSFALYVRQTKYTAELARNHMAALLALGLRSAATSDLAAEALDLATAQGINGYDAFYLALSVRIKAPLITADEKMVRALKGRPFDVHLLRDLDDS